MNMKIKEKVKMTWDEIKSLGIEVRGCYHEDGGVGELDSMYATSCLVGVDKEGHQYDIDDWGSYAYVI